MIKFLSIQIKNFMSIGNTPLVFDYSSGLTYVYGENLDVSEKNESNTISNGSGKTVVLVDAPLFALYGRTQRKIKKSEIVNNQNCSDCEVILTLDKDGVIYTIERGLKPDKILISKNGVPESEEAKKRQANKIIEEELLDGISYEVFKNLVVLNGTSSKHFFEYGKNEKRVFINEVFRLGFLEYLQTKLTDESKSKKIELDKLEIQYIAKEKEIERLKNLHEAQKNGTLVDMTKDLSDKINIESEKVKSLNLMIEQIQQTNFANQSYELFQEQYNSAKTKTINVTNELIKIETQINNLKSTYTRLKSEYDKINKENVCSHCTQPIPDSLKRQLFESMQEQIKKVIEEGKTKGDLKKKLEDRKVVMDQWVNNAKLFIENYKLATQQLQTSLTIMNQYQSQLKTTEETPNNLDKITEEINTTERELYEIDAAKKTLTREYNIIKVSRDLVGGKNFYGYYIGVFRSYLNKSINEYLEKMMSPHRIKFNNDLEADVFDGNLQMSSYDTLSTGEKSKINIALLLSFFDVLQSFHRMETSILVLDEVLDSGVDTQGIEKLHKILVEKSKEKPELGIYVVSHKNSENTFAEKEGVEKVVFQRNLGFTTLKG